VRGGLGLADDSAGRPGAASYDVPVTRFVQQPDYEGAEFTGLSMASATFREVDLSGARMHGVLLSSADIDGAIDGLRVNGVEVMPLIEAELDRLHPERLRLRPATPETMRDAVDVIEELWQATVRRASSLPEEAVYRSVNDEWSLAQTLRQAQGKRILAASVQKDQVRPGPRHHDLKDIVQTDSASPKVAFHFDVRIHRKQIIFALELNGMTGKEEKRGIGFIQ